jgi:glycosyltransferase involved in cell wall biosynthesis
LINTFPINLILGEGGLFYIIRLARRGERIIRSERITALYSSYRPMADHAAAWWLKRRHPGLTWIADFRDLPVDPHTRHVLFPGWHRRLYRRMFQRADILTTVSEGLAKHLSKGHPHVVVTRNGLPEDWRMPEPVQCPHFTIAYTGSMFLDMRDPAPLFDALAGMVRDGGLSREDLRIVYAGKDGAEWRQRAAAFGLGEQCEDRGLVSPEAAWAIQREANINILLTYSSPELGGVLTGKMIEYIAAGNPVLAINTGTRDAEIDHLLTSISLGRSFTGDAESRDQIRSFISGEYVHWKKTGKNRKPADEVRIREVFSPVKLLEPLWEALARR